MVGNPDEEAIPEDEDNVEVTVEENDPVWNAPMVVVKTPVIVRICVVRGQIGQA